MQNKQNTGVDTFGMLPVLAAIFLAGVQLLAPWVSIPALKYTQMSTRYSLWQLETGLEQFQKSVGMSGTKLAGAGLTEGEFHRIAGWADGAQILSAVTIVLMLLAAAAAYRYRGKSVTFVRISFLHAMLLPVLSFGAVCLVNQQINEKLGRVSDFINLTIHSYVQLSAYPYGQLFIAGLMAVWCGRLLRTETAQETCWEVRSIQQDKKIGKRTWTALLLIFIAIPFFIFFGIFFLNNRSHTFIALCIILLAMLPFCMVFEDRKPQTREVLLIAVLAAIAVAGRVAFFMIPQFKPVTAIVIITGISLGAEAGFLTGAIAGFVSNFFFGQGPWTPWQMFAFGIIGFLAGLLFCQKRWEKNKALICMYGGLASVVIYGLIMDSSSLLYLINGGNLKSILAIYVSGLPFNVIHGISTVVFLFFLAEPMDRKLSRIKKKYGVCSR